MESEPEFKIYKLKESVLGNAIQCRLFDDNHGLTGLDQWFELLLCTGKRFLILSIQANIFVVLNL